MMMSMFSSFDALCAESFGQKLKFSFSPPNEGNKPEVESMKKSVMSEGNKDKSSTSPPANINKSSQQQKRRPRFAPELDGVTILSPVSSTDGHPRGLSKRNRTFLDHAQVQRSLDSLTRTAMLELGNSSPNGSFQLSPEKSRRLTRATMLELGKVSPNVHLHASK
ncbi:unnamed protein product [Dovyalis caffra]|uniref:Uncharacterized protein n=1 Tax=Dovyalis caffra TaxID=77055 RepID=A0AAV1QVY4_9ROSI|nr:unnamed protein product [Dovyalis caffra]